MLSVALGKKRKRKVSQTIYVILPGFGKLCNGKIYEEKIAIFLYLPQKMVERTTSFHEIRFLTFVRNDTRAVISNEEGRRETEISASRNHKISPSA